MKTELPDLPDFPENFRLLENFLDFSGFRISSGFQVLFRTASGPFRILNIFYLFHYISAIN
jgi:hypothetical protein